MELKVLRANPAGNITLFVLDPVPCGDRAGIAAKLLALPDLDAEQVGFAGPPLCGGAGRVEMAGGEFCGNAARAFGMLISQQKSGLAHVLVEISGCDGPIPVDVDWSAHTARTRMPLPRAVRPIQVGGAPGTLVDLGGIVHLVVEHVSPSLDFFSLAEPLFQDFPGLEAYGVIFLDGNRLTPLVKVPAVGSLVWEGSCGSGSLAAAIAQSQTAPDGVCVRDYFQPAGTIQASVLRRNGTVDSAFIGGPVYLDSPFIVQL